MTETVEISALERFVHGTAFVLVGNLVGIGATFIARVFAARYLTTASYGLFVLGLTSLSVFSLISLLGLPNGLARQIPRSDYGIASFYSALQISLPLSIFFSGAAFLLAEPVSEFLGLPRFEPVLSVFVLGLPFLVTAQLIVGSLRGLEDVQGRIVVENFLIQGAPAAIVVVGSILGLDLLVLVKGWVIVLFFTSIFSVYLLYRRTELLKEYRTYEFGSIIRSMPLVSFSIPLMIADTLWIVLRQSDIFLLGYYVDTVAVGVYDAAFTLANILLMLANAAGFLSLPLFSKIHSNRTTEEMASFYRTITKWIVFLSLPVYLSVVAFPAELLTIVFGSAYTGGAFTVIVVTTGFFTHVLLGQNGNALTAGGHTTLLLWGTGSAVVVNLLLNVLLIPLMGISGAALASAVAYAALNVYLSYQLYVKYGIIPFYRPLVRPALASIFAFVLIFVSVQRLFDSVYLVLIITTTSFLVCYPPLIVYMGGLESSDKALLRAIDRQLPVDLHIFSDFLH